MTQVTHKELMANLDALGEAIAHIIPYRMRFTWMMSHQVNISAFDQHEGETAYMLSWRTSGKQGSMLPDGFSSDEWEENPSEIPGRISEMPGDLPEWRKRVASTELYYALAKRASSPSQAHALYLEAVLRARAAMAERLTIAAAFDPGQRLLAGIYNRGLARVMVLGQEVYGHPATWTGFARLDGQEPVRFRSGENLYEPADFDSYLAAEERGSRARVVQQPIGSTGPMPTPCWRRCVAHCGASADAH